MEDTTHPFDASALRIPVGKGSRLYSYRSANSPARDSSRQCWGFRVMAGVLLLAVGLKLMSFIYPTRWLDQPNAIFPFAERWVLVLAMAMDIGVAVTLLSRRISHANKLLIGGWLLGVFATYRLGLFWLGDPKHCGCVGDPSAWWPWLKDHSAFFTGLLGVLLLTAYASAILHKYVLNKN